MVVGITSSTVLVVVYVRVTVEPPTVLVVVTGQIVV